MRAVPPRASPVGEPVSSVFGGGFSSAAQCILTFYNIFPASPEAKRSFGGGGKGVVHEHLN